MSVSFCSEVLGQGWTQVGPRFPRKAIRAGSCRGSRVGAPHLPGPLPPWTVSPRGLGQHLRLWSLQELQPLGIQGGRWIPATDPYLLHCSALWADPPTCPLLGPPVLPCGGKLI